MIMTSLNFRYSFGQWCVQCWKEQLWPSTIGLQNALVSLFRCMTYPISYHHTSTNTNTRRNAVGGIISWEETTLEEAHLILGLNLKEDFHSGCSWPLAGQPGEKAGQRSGIGGLRKSPTWTPRGRTWCSCYCSRSTELQQHYRFNNLIVGNSGRNTCLWIVPEWSIK